MWDHIGATIGSLRAETGGMLGGWSRDGIITHFYFDGTASRTTGGPMQIKIESKYAQFATLHLSTHGVVRAAA